MNARWNSWKWEIDEREQFYARVNLSKYEKNVYLIDICWKEGAEATKRKSALNSQIKLAGEISNKLQNIVRKLRCRFDITPQ